MRGWTADGEPFRKLLNQNEDIPAEASRVHGYTCEILERDGEPPVRVNRDFAEDAGNLPLVSFNLEYDLDEVLKPESRRLRVAATRKQNRPRRITREPKHKQTKITRKPRPPLPGKSS